jgi:hypothetical protein
MSKRLQRALRVLAGLILAAPTALHAQSSLDAPCDYARCSLAILPRLSGLDVVRGSDEVRIASLPFLRARDVRHAFTGDANAQRHAVSAMRLRRAGSLFTALGIAGGVTAAWRGGSAHDRVGAAAFGAAGASLFLVSVPLHFAADAELSRAVRDFNTRFAR